MVAVANLVVCGAVVTVLSAVRDAGDGPPAAFPADVANETTETTDAQVIDEPTVDSQDETTPTDTGESGPAGGFSEITGPGGMTTHIPAGWPVTQTTSAGSMQADDPSGTTTMLRFGGSATTATDTYQIHADYERDFSATKQGYASLRLDRTTVRGMPAIDWEFEYDAPEGRRHVRSVYWLSGGYEYFVYASSLVQRWEQTRKVLEVMLTYATP